MSLRRNLPTSLQLLDAARSGPFVARDATDFSAASIGPRGIGNDSLVGTSAADQIAAGAGDDTADGLGGNDTLYGEAGNDSLLGSGGNDLVTGADGNDTLIGGLGADTLHGGNGYDLVQGEWGDDLLTAGNDGGALYGGDDNDTLLGGFHNDLLDGGDGNDSLSGGDGADRLDGGAGTDTLRGGAGHDTLVGGATGIGAADSLYGEAGDDQLVAGAQGALLDGGAGDDALGGRGGNDTLVGGLGSDTMEGGLGNDVYVVDDAGDVAFEAAGAGVDIVVTSASAWTLGAAFEQLRLTSTGAANGTGNALDNLIYAGAGDNVLDGAGGVDTATYVFAAAAVTVSLDVSGPQATGGSGTDTLLGFENLSGSQFDDTLAGNAGANVLLGGNGNDTLAAGDGNDLVLGEIGNDVVGGGEGNDTLHGNDGNDTLFGSGGDDVIYGDTGVDTVSYASASAGVTVGLYSPYAQATGGAGTDTLYTIENLTGSGFADFLSGNFGVNRLEGGAGDDTLQGLDAADVLVGGAGADLFRYTSLIHTTLAAPDTIADFTSGADRIDLAGMFGGTFNFIGGAAFSATNATGQLRYEGGIVYGSTDADATAEFAIVLTGAPAITAADFVL